MKLITEKVFSNYVSIKSKQSYQETYFIASLFDGMKRIVDFYIDLCWKLRIQGFEQKEHIKDLNA